MLMDARWLAGLRGWLVLKWGFDKTSSLPLFDLVASNDKVSLIHTITLSASREGGG